MNVVAFGESALLLSDLGNEPKWAIAERLRIADLQGVVEITSGYETIAIYLEHDCDTVELVPTLEKIIQEDDSSSIFETKLHEIPVCYQLGEDLEPAATLLGLSPMAFAETHSSVLYTCVCLGFQPGFPYLEGLPAKLQGLPRLPQPRVRVPSGSVAITLDQAGIYPAPSPGGWHLIGRTPLEIADPAISYFPIRPGDKIRFLPITNGEYERLGGQRL